MTDRRDASPHNQVVRAFCDAYESHMGTKYPFAAGKDGKIIKDLLVIYPPEQIETFIAAFFEIDDEFIANAGFSLGVFRGCLPKLIAHVRKGSRPSKTDRMITETKDVIAEWTGRAPLRRVQ